MLRHGRKSPPSCLLRPSVLNTCADISQCAGNEITGYYCVWLCNDNNHAIRLETNWFASFVDDIQKACNKLTTFTMTRGQFFSTDGYNVIVGNREGVWDATQMSFDQTEGANVTLS